MSDPDFIRFMKTRYSLSQFLVNNRMMWERWPTSSSLFSFLKKVNSNLRESRKKQSRNSLPPASRHEK